MSKSNKVIWEDGMFIYPQHFQQQDIYYENLLSNYQLLQPYHNFGIIELEIDTAYLKLNKIFLRKGIGVFPNGTLFNITNSSTAPIIIDVPKDYTNKLVYLGLPIQNKYSYEDQLVKKNRYIKYYVEEEEVIDMNSESEEAKKISIGRLNVNLFLEEEELESIVLLPIIKILDANNGINIDKTYIPPCIQVTASDCLLNFISTIQGLLNNYINSNASFFGEETFINQLNKTESLLIFQTVNHFKYLFELMSKDKKLTPYLLFQNIVSLIAFLIVFVKNSSSIPINTDYEHSDLSSSFDNLLNTVNAIFRALSEFQAVQINFRLDENGTYIAKLSSISSLDNLDLIVGIEFEQKQSEEEANKIARLIKIAAINDIKRIISLQVSGVICQKITTLPPYVAYNEKTLYLRIIKENNFWTQITNNKDITLYLGSKLIKPVSVKLWAVP